ncbi:HlyD family efflux transporter periplasmic adaptor subunit [Herbivorax sp. ANBcel31]|uniref:HlyD family secretion protein n=1 Tax=Herbivorax sp. ANBcel31 TaxID=3069754 RepID=UPI0027B75359|nr:HlyD family efflux transporter periplasmic adaptor subunit [Herbivorax sp. ANBcel31]MDQ2086708.1 HlyD family efflux transporter periplasmic adaptor subunit [Herbivorax sp. ANBcel31]
MSNQAKSLAELKDSRILYDKKLPQFGYIIIITVVVLIFGVIMWSTRTPKVEIVKSTGTVQSTDKNHVMSPYNGQIINISIEEGMLVEKGDVLFTVKSTDLDLQEKQLDEQKTMYLNQISQLKKLVESIKDNVNYFDEWDKEDSIYYYQYKSYQSQIAQNEVDTAMYKAYGYTDEQIESEVIKNKSKVAEIHYSTLSGIEENIMQFQSELNSINAQLIAIGKGQDDYQIRANATGRIHMMADYREGMVIQAGSAIANIASQQDKYKVEAYVPTENIAKISVEDKVDIAVAGLAQNVYGTISGKVKRIDSDVTNDSENDARYFKVDIMPDNTYLINKDGYKVNLSNGMEVETRIQYDHITYFNYVLESLGLLVR